MGEYDFRTKSVTVQAVRFTGDNWLEMGQFCGATLNDATEGQPYKMAGGDWLTRVRPMNEEAGGGVAYLRVDTLKGTLPCWPGDWLLRGTTGELYPVTNTVFEAKYERIATIRQPEHVIVFGGGIKPNMHHPEGCDVSQCQFTTASMRIPLPMLEMHGSWTCRVTDPFESVTPALVLKDKIA